jgi:hypothetical protein
VGDVQHDHPAKVTKHDSVVHHPIRATAHEATELLVIAAEGTSTATPAILVGAVLAFIVPLATLLILLAFGIAHFS